MLSCKELVARSSDYLDGQLTLGERLMVRQHLLFCRHCRRFLKQMRVAQATVRALPEQPAGDSEALAERLARELKNS
ncbi:zf-HC2 domain-containing protein [Pseudomonas sp. BIGb0427]|uniref:anti-sigma factor family protein n=1 Tax=unclassified Pseudomonas TaxID=196821 RepID=UPI00088A02E6|nr:MULTISPECIES: zf-HC2 domain-containing protein [unclassified Pseudomonas]QPG60661.1 zf-HC2 domain-containing protein [Pseudomonas sp. BIGb0427]QVM95421.1 zf-HC2 domain-containing protein [Pseudomonas sp. SORT22]UVL57719.1 zf-HC2 domain-containing protein [Pseudomonas sp. B21-035]UVL63027.1 zf-HC2 domain-containing protein [Pseudomonas sp. B21-032]UVM57355.1 zf-HC2 domain-containing protein [Pseudomonas sp. B21-012]